MIKPLTAALLILVLSSCGGIISDRVYPGSALSNQSADNSPEARNFVRSDGEPRKYYWLSSPNPKGTVLYLHGNAELAGIVFDKLKEENLGYNFAILEYTGYGSTDGRPSQPELRKDVASAAADVRDNYPNLPFILAGSSLGGSLAILSSQDFSIDGLITSSAFTTMADIAPAWARSILSQRHAYDALGAAGSVSAPWVIMHCNKDIVVPASMAERLHRLANPEMSALLLLECDKHPTPAADWKRALSVLNKLR